MLNYCIYELLKSGIKLRVEIDKDKTESRNSYAKSSTMEAYNSMMFIANGVLSMFSGTDVINDTL